MVVAGCLAQSRRDEFFADFPFVDVLVGPQSLSRAARTCWSERLAGGGRRGGLRTRRPPAGAPICPACARTGPLAWVQIMAGCSNYCTYCIVPVRARAGGLPARRRHPRRGARLWPTAGVREITLLGQNVNAYGQEPGFAGGETSPGCSSGLRDVAGIERIRFMTSHPKDMSRRL